MPASMVNRAASAPPAMLHTMSATLSTGSPSMPGVSDCQSVSSYTVASASPVMMKSPRCQVLVMVPWARSPRSAKTALDGASSDSSTKKVSGSSRTMSRRASTSKVALVLPAGMVTVCGGVTAV